MNPLKSPSDTQQPIFVFGSNLAGRHGKGAALTARFDYGAQLESVWAERGRPTRFRRRTPNCAP